MANLIFFYDLHIHIVKKLNNQFLNISISTDILVLPRGENSINGQQQFQREFI